MRPSFQTDFQVDMTVDKTYSLICNTLAHLANSNLTIVKEIPNPSTNLARKPSYVLLEYRKGLFGISRNQIELRFKDWQMKTIVSLKWFLPSYEYQIQSSDGLAREMWIKNAREAEQEATILVEELKSRINATEITSDQEAAVKEKEIIARVRCPYCANLYDETLDKCPHCGGHR